MNKKILVTLSLLIILGLSACGPAATPIPEATEAPTSPPAAEAGPENILIGTSAPLTGMFAGFGEGCTWGAQAAVDDINAQGGIFVKEFNRKIPVKYVLVDNQSDPQKSGPLAEDLILREKVNMLYSVDSSPSIHIPIAEVAEKYGIPHIVGGGPLEPWLGARSERLSCPKEPSCWNTEILMGGLGYTKPCNR